MKMVSLNKPKSTTYGKLRRKIITKVLPVSLLAFFVYNSFDNPSVEMYRQLYEVSEQTPSEQASKTYTGRFRYCKTPYVLISDLMNSVPKVIPPKDRMDSPSHVQLCKALLDRVDLDESKLQSLPIVSIREDPAVCVDWSAPHYSVMSIFASSVIAAKGVKYGLRYSHNCHTFLTHTREGSTHYDYTTVQEVLPENLISGQDADSIDLDLVKDLCSGCITANADETKPDSFETTTNHCLLFPEKATADAIVSEQEKQIPLSSVLSSFVDRMRHMTEDWIDATNAIKNEEESGVIIALDAKSTFMDFGHYDMSIPFEPSSIQILASANCAVASLSKKSDCISIGRALKAYFKRNYPNAYVRYDVVASTATSYARMMKVKLLICPPGTVKCLLPALGKLAGKKAVVAEDGSLPETFHWFEHLIEKRKSLGLNQVGVDLVDDEDFLVINEETHTDMPEDLEFDEIDEDEDIAVVQVQEAQQQQSQEEPEAEKPFDLNLDTLIGADMVAPPEQINDVIADPEVIAPPQEVINDQDADAASGRNSASASLDAEIQEEIDATAFSGSIANDVDASNTIFEQEFAPPVDLETQVMPEVNVPQINSAETSIDEVDESAEYYVPRHHGGETSVDMGRTADVDGEVNVDLSNFRSVADGASGRGDVEPPTVEADEEKAVMDGSGETDVATPAVAADEEQAEMSEAIPALAADEEQAAMGEATPVVAADEPIDAQQ